ncbi:hypothetical protein A5637_04800 [Mycolicibacterium fortuitum]|nr:hypothetical protein A5637_04800 [Mycolicibacterium fortuitum]
MTDNASLLHWDQLTQCYDVHPHDRSRRGKSADRLITSTIARSLAQERIRLQAKLFTYFDTAEQPIVGC